MNIVDSSEYIDIDAFGLCKKMPAIKHLECLSAIKNHSYALSVLKADNAETLPPDQTIEYLKSKGIFATAAALCLHGKLYHVQDCRPSMFPHHNK